MVIVQLRIQNLNFCIKLKIIQNSIKYSTNILVSLPSFLMTQLMIFRILIRIQSCPIRPPPLIIQQAVPPYTEEEEEQRHNQQPQTTHTHHGVINKHTTEKQTKSSHGTPGWFRNDEMMIERAKSKQMPLKNKTTTTNEEREETISIGNFLGLIGMPRPTQTRRLGSGRDIEKRSLRWTHLADLEEVDILDQKTLLKSKFKTMSRE